MGPPPRPPALLSLFVLTNLFLWTYLPQVRLNTMNDDADKGREEKKKVLMEIYRLPSSQSSTATLAWLNATFLVLGEGAAIAALLFEAFFVDETLVDVFDAVLLNEDHADLVAPSRIIIPSSDPKFNSNSNSNNSINDTKTPVPRLGKPTTNHKPIYSPFSLRQIFEFVIFLPLNLIPVAGTPVFLILTGYRAGPLQHWRCFQLLHLTKKERKAVVKRRRLRYMWFGTVALMLQLVPVLSMGFLLMTAVGSALWVGGLEDGRKRRRAEEEEEEARGEDGGGERYVDDPA